MLNIRFIEFARVYGKNMLMTGATLIAISCCYADLGKCPVCFAAQRGCARCGDWISLDSGYLAAQVTAIRRISAVLSHIKTWRRKRLSGG